MATVHPYDPSCPLCRPASRCECGQPVSRHRALPTPPPLASWQAEHAARRELAAASAEIIRVAGGRFGRHPRKAA